MKFANVIGNTTKFLNSLKLKRDPKLSKMDFGILRVSMMIAALDGKVQKSEIETFETLAKRCRGYSKKTADEAMQAALKSAGYLMLLSQVAPKKQLLSEFIAEALFVMPNGFLNGSMEDVRRAFITWMAMAIGDGDYSENEREAIELLKKSWCEMRNELVDGETEKWLAMSPNFRMAYGVGATRPKLVKLIADDFLDRVENALIKFDEAKLSDIIKNG